jgi:hypothetical protein
MPRPTSDEQSSEATQEVPPTLDDNTFYVRPSPAGTLQLAADVRSSTHKDTRETHGLTVYTPVNRGEVASLVSKDLGTAKTIVALCHKARQFTEEMAKNEGKRNEGRRYTDVKDYDTIFKSMLAKSKLNSEKRLRGSIYKVELLDGPEPSATVFKDQGFETVIPRQLDDVNIRISEEMARVVENEQPPAPPTRTPTRRTACTSARTASSGPDKVAIFDDDDVTHVRPEGFEYFFDLHKYTDLDE